MKTQKSNHTVETTPLVLEAGKYYKMRDGRTVGPLEKVDGLWITEDYVDGYAPMWDKETGKCEFFTTPSINDTYNRHDLIEEVAQ